MAIRTIVLITTGQPSVNPRVVKEADAFQAAGHHVIVLYCFWIQWATVADLALLKNVKWSYQLIGGNLSVDKPTYYYTRLRNKVNIYLNKHFGNNFFFAERSQARCYNELLKVAKSLKADWYIGHNLGALPIAVKAAKYNKAKCGFDFEDYHREEVYKQALYDLQRIVFLENKYVPQLDYVSTSSPLISKKFSTDFPAYKQKIVTSLNCFSLTQQLSFRIKLPDDNTLQLFWFSQTIGKNRGLEVIFQVLQELKDQSIHLTLAGRCNKDLEEYIDENAASVKDNIHFAGIISPDNLPAFAAKFDVGLAIELKTPNNRNICLTNKIFTYLLAGNAIILSATDAQENFNNEYNVGLAFNIGNTTELKSHILAYKNVAKLETQRMYNYDLANKRMNWEYESKKLLSIIE